MKRPDYWANWTRWVPLPIILILCVLTAPLFCIAGAWRALPDWQSEFLEIWREFKGENDGQ